MKPFEREMEDSLISVIVPVYNVANYVLICLQSIQKQTYRNLEVIIVDDGSTDGGGEICDRFVKTDERFTVIHQSNRGLSAARNAGLDAAKGQFVMFVDSDDFVHPQMAEILLQCSLNNNAEVAICKYLPIQKADDVDIQPIIEAECHVSVVSGIESCQRIYTESSCESIISWNKLYWRGLFENMRFPVGKIHEDEFVTYRILYETERVVYVDAILYYYLQRPGSIMQQKQYGEEHMVLLEMGRECVSFYLFKGNTQLAGAALQRAYGLYGMLYRNYGITERKDLQKTVLKHYRRLFADFHRLAELNVAQELAAWLYGYSPAASDKFLEMKHILWKIKKRIWKET